MTDRVATTATVWLGLTLGCAQCHTHKFDPIPHRDYYQFMALLNNADEPELAVPSPEIARRRRELEARIAALTGFSSSARASHCNCSVPNRPGLDKVTSSESKINQFASAVFSSAIWRSRSGRAAFSSSVKVCQKCWR